MTRLLVVLVALVALTSCAAQTQGTWQKPGTSVTQRQQDAAQCKYEADKAFASAPRCVLCEVGSSGDLIVDAVAGTPSSKMVAQCMALRGYRQN
jgi:hypothetical protein